MHPAMLWVSTLYLKKNISEKKTRYNYIYVSTTFASFYVTGESVLGTKWKEENTNFNNTYIDEKSNTFKDIILLWAVVVHQTVIST